MVILRGENDVIEWRIAGGDLMVRLFQRPVRFGRDKVCVYWTGCGVTDRGEEALALLEGRQTPFSNP